MTCVYLSQIWRIEYNDMIPVKQDSYGVFYGGDCYVVQYTYMVKNKDNYIVYYWQVGFDFTNVR